MNYKSPEPEQLKNKSAKLEDYLNLIPPEILESFSPEQKTATLNLIKKLVSPPAPKLVDLRFTVDLIITRYYVVLFLGKDRRSKKRPYLPEKVNRIANLISATIILVSLNLFIIGVVLLVLYLTKSLIGINFFEGHISDTVEKFFQNK